MRKVDIRSKCRVNSNREMDTFVGLRCNDGDISINFPLGYHISEDDNELRKDIMLLLTTLSANTERKESEILKQGNAFDEVEFPLQSYMYLIKDFFVRGYYKEQEVLYKVAKSGKINWNRTDVNLAYLVIKSLPYLGRESDKKRLLQTKDTSLKRMN